MREWLNNIPVNLFSGFVVSLIALPLSLGLAMAAGIPPIAGIIAAVVGGFVLSIFGGSYVTIAGPGNGLVVATLGAVTLLGQGDIQQGYLLALAAVVVSGGVIFLLGLFKVGIIGEYFPSAAVQGMLAAIGLIIVSKQLHILIGVVNPPFDGAVALYTGFPASLSRTWAGEIPILAFYIGVGALLILIVHSYIKRGFLKKIPAPVLAVAYGMGLNYLAQINAISTLPLPTNFLIQLPENVVSQLAFPDFSMLWSYPFFMAVFSLTFIATTETLLSIKAVDKLDPLRRRSNVNKDLRAIGAATVLSGMLGGMNPVIAIARSSVNVTNGATWRSANFFQSLFLAIFILAFSSVLNKIPLPALAAILVFTGYRLASPKVFTKVAKVGVEQLVIFITTLLVTLFTDLILGMASGMALTFFLQVSSKTRASLILRNFFKPNTLLYQEESGKYHLSVRAYSNFTNFVGLKKKLDSLPTDAEVIVDFSLSRFVDYSVMEQLEGYTDTFEKYDGKLEVIGLDDLTSNTDHPLASRKIPKALKPNRNSGRQDALMQYFDKKQWTVYPNEQQVKPTLLHFTYFADKTIESLRNGAYKLDGHNHISFTDVDYHEGELLTKRQYHASVAIVHLKYEIPSFVMDKENLLHRVSTILNFTRNTLSEYPDFSKNFNVQANRDSKLKSFFTPELISFFEEHKPYHIESYENKLLIFEKERLATIAEFKQLVRFALDLQKTLTKEQV